MGLLDRLDIPPLAPYHEFEEEERSVRLRHKMSTCKKTKLAGCNGCFARCYSKICMASTRPQIHNLGHSTDVAFQEPQGKTIFRSLLQGTVKINPMSFGTNESSEEIFQNQLEISWCSKFRGYGFGMLSKHCASGIFTAKPGGNTDTMAGLIYEQSRKSPRIGSRFGGNTCCRA